MPGDIPALLGTLDIELLGILKITCELVGHQQADRWFDSQTIQPSNGSICKETKTARSRDNVDVVDTNPNTSYYFRSSINRAADKRGSQALIQKLHNEFNIF